MVNGELSSYIESLHSFHYKYSHDYGDAKEKFSIQSAGKAFNYGFFNDAIGREEVTNEIRIDNNVLNTISVYACISLLFSYHSYTNTLVRNQVD